MPRCEQQRLSVVAAGFDLVSGTHGCAYWADGAEYGSVGDGSASLRSAPRTVRVGDFFGGPAQQSVVCPQEVGDAIFGVDWLALV